MRAVRDFAARPTVAAASPARQPRRTKAAAPAVQGRRRRPQRGANAQLIAEVLKAMPSGSGRAADIRKALQADKGVAMAFTSIRHALGQMASRKEVEASDDGKTWRYVGASS